MNRSGRSLRVLFAWSVAAFVLASALPIAAGAHLGTGNRPTVGPATLGPLPAAASLGPTPALAPSNTAPAVPSAGSSSGTWVNLSLTSAEQPPYRSYDRSMAYDPVDGYVLLFGGYTGGYLADTWTFANGTWTQLHPSTAPTPRDHSTLVWDAADGYLLLFGGSGYSGAYNDTWSYLGGTWTQIHTSVAPSQRWAASMTYDASDGYALLFGGCVSGVAASDTWKFLNGTWTELHPATVPDDRQDGQITYDAQLGAVVMFSGGGYYGASYQDTWSYHGAAWTNVTTSPQPPARQSGGMAYDSNLGEILLFGGMNSLTSAALGDTWAYDGTGWTQLYPSSAPGVEVFPALADDPGDHTLLHYGVTTAGSPVTWVWDGVSPFGNSSTARGPAPLSVQFNVSTSSGAAPINYSWSFGDATTGFGPAPLHVYQDPGLFDASVTVSDRFGSSAVLHFFEESLIPLGLVASATPVNGTPPLLVGFNASAIGGYPPYQYLWSFGDGASDNVAAPNHLYANPGAYVATVVATDQKAQSWSGTVHVQVQSPISPIWVTIVATATSGTAPLLDQFTAAVSGGFAPYSYVWSASPGGGSFTSTSESPTFTFSTPALYVLSLKVADRYGNHALASTSVNVTAVLTANAGETSQTPSGGSAPLNASFLVSADGGSPPYVFTWDFGDGGTGSGASVWHVFQSSGTFEVSARSYDRAGGSVVSAVHLTVLPAVVVPPTKNSTHSTAPVNASSSASWVGGLGVGLLAGAAVGGALAYFLTRRPPTRRMGRR